MFERNSPRKSAHISQRLTWWRTGPDALRSPSAASASSSRTSPQVSWREWVASASDIRARTSSDLTAGTVVSIVVAMSSYERASISRSSRAVR